MKRVVIGLLLLLASGCEHKLPPQASAATRAIDKTAQLAHVLLYVQDGALALNNTPSKVLNDADTAVVMHAMFTAGVAMKAAPSGAKAIAVAVMQSLEGENGLSPGGKKALGPYLRFAQLFFDSLNEVTR